MNTYFEVPVTSVYSFYSMDHLLSKGVLKVKALVDMDKARVGKYKDLTKLCQKLQQRKCDWQTESLFDASVITTGADVFDSALI